jgi:hypothetical protein
MCLFFFLRGNPLLQGLWIEDFQFDRKIQLEENMCVTASIANIPEITKINTKNNELDFREYHRLQNHVISGHWLPSVLGDLPCKVWKNGENGWRQFPVWAFEKFERQTIFNSSRVVLEPIAALDIGSVDAQMS